MAIVRGQDGRYYDIEESALEGREVQPEDAPQEAQSSTGPASGPPPGVSLAEGAVQIIINLPGGSGGSGHSGPSGSGEADSQPEGGDVEGHNYCSWRNWRNWKNWRNCGWQNSGFEPVGPNQ